MGDRVPSDHDSIDTDRVTVAAVGRTSRKQVELPDELPLSDGDVVRVTIDGAEYHAPVEAGLDGTLAIPAVYDNARLAKTPNEGADRLEDWLDGVGIDAGRSLLLDELVVGAHYGLREPGERVVYTVREPPDDSLADIAGDLGE